MLRHIRTVTLIIGHKHHAKHSTKNSRLSVHQPRIYSKIYIFDSFEGKSLFHTSTKLSASHYEVLGVSPNATPDEIKASYHAKAKKLHPDVAGNTASNRAKFLELQQAYETLRDPQRRVAYDQMLRRFKSGGSGGASRNRSQKFGWGWEWAQAGSGEQQQQQQQQQQQNYYQQQQQHYSQQQRFSESDLEEAYLAGYHAGQKEAAAATKGFKTVGGLMSAFGGFVAFIIIAILMNGTHRTKNEIETQRKIIAEQEKKINGMKWILDRLPATEKVKVDDLTQQQAKTPQGWAQNPARIPVVQKYRDPSVGGPPRPEPPSMLGSGPVPQDDGKTPVEILTFSWDKMKGK